MPEQDLLAPTVLGAVARRSRLTALVVLAFALLGLLYSLSQKATATASASFVVAQPADAATDGNFVNDQVSIIQFASTADAAATILKQTFPTSTLTGDDVLNDEKVLGGTSSNLITIQFANADPAVAQAGANSLVKAYTNLLAETASANLQTRSTQFNTTIADLTRQVAAAGGAATTQGAALEAARLAQIESLSQLQSSGGSASSVTNSSVARLPRTGRSLKPVEGLILGGIVGLIPAVALVYFLAQFRRKFTDRFQPEVLLQRQLLSEIPEFVLEGLRSDVPAADAPHSSSAEAFRFVSTALDDRAQEDGPLIVAVSGGSSLDGKTTVAANLAVTFARRGLRTIAVDADLDGHGLGFLLLGEKRHAPGLAEVLAGRVRVPDVIQPAQSDIDTTLRVLPAGLLHGPAITDLVSKQSVRRAMVELGSEADVLVIDVPSPLQVAYASSVLAAVGRCLVVVPHGSSPAKLQEFSVRVAALGVDAIGYVYTKAPLRRELGQLSRYVTDKRRVPFASADESPRESPATKIIAPRPMSTEIPAAATEPPVAASPILGPDWEARFANAANELHSTASSATARDVLPFYIGEGGGEVVPPTIDDEPDTGGIPDPGFGVNLMPIAGQTPYKPVGAFLSTSEFEAAINDGPGTPGGPAPHDEPSQETPSLGELTEDLPDESAVKDDLDDEIEDLHADSVSLTAPRLRKRTRQGS